MRHMQTLSPLVLCPSILIGVHAASAAGEDDSRALVAELIADAETRSSLLASSPRYHDGKNFAIESDDGNFKLGFRGQIQFRYILNWHDENTAPNGSAEDDFESGFQTRRTKLGLEGHIVDPSLTYKVLSAASRSSGDFALEEAFMRKQWKNGISIQIGQQKLPFAREEVVSSSLQLAVERSLINQVFGQEYSQGVVLAWSGEQVRLFGAFSDGIASRNSEFGEPKRITPNGFPNSTTRGESDYAITARFEWLASGSWNQFRDFTSPEGSEFGIMFGAAAHIEGGDPSSSAFSNGTYRYTTWTADLSLEGDGWNGYLAGFGASGDYHATANDLDHTDYAMLMQGGIMIPETQWEPFARLELLFPDQDRQPSPDSIPILTVGTNWYMHGHAAKFTIDAVWLMEDASSLVSARPALGILGSDEDDEILMRIQWQLLF